MKTLHKAFVMMMHKFQHVIEVIFKETEDGANKQTEDGIEKITEDSSN